MVWKGVIEKYKKYLPVTDKTPIVSILEGNTPLIFAKNITEELGGNLKIYLKYEGLNPTGSFKDRGMTMAVSKAVEAGAKAVMCASTGNTSASAAAYSARSKLRCIVLIPQGSIALGKLAQALMHGAEVLAIEGNFDQALEIVREITDKYPIVLVNSLNPYRIEGQKTASFEVCDVLGKAPVYHALPVGNAGNITAYWMGYKEYQKNNIISELPKMLGFQAAGSAPIVDGKIIKNPKTLATAIKIGNPASWEKAVTAAKESGGLIDKVTDDEIVAAYKMLASCEGVFAEPASAASLAGVIKYKQKGYFSGAEATIVCTLTGHGLKDPELAVNTVGQPKICPANIEAVVKELGI